MGSLRRPWYRNGVYALIDPRHLQSFGAARARAHAGVRLDRERELEAAE